MPLSEDSELKSDAEPQTRASSDLDALPELDHGDFDLTTLPLPSGDLPEQLGDYRIERLIGSGGMGRVYLAEHRRMERIVALKTLSAERMGDAAAIERFYGEVRAAARLLHPNIVTAFDAGESGGIHYLAMEYINGPTLTQVVAERGPLPVSDAVDVLRQAAVGLLYAHQAGIVHRDVKPGNLMRAPDGTIKVLDLGLATMGVKASTGSKKGRLVGTIEYMSPEQLEDPESADARSDIYSLGATFFFLLTGRSPYSGGLLDQIRGHRDAALPDLFALRHDIDLRLDHVLQRMMAKRPQQRYANLSEVIEDLTHWTSEAGKPSWLAGIGGPVVAGEVPTDGGETTASTTAEVIGIDLGMFYAAAAMADPTGEVRVLDAGGAGKPLLRLALASSDRRLIFGAEALHHRERHPHRTAHCLPLYIGQTLVDRRIAGQCCPPEVLVGLLLRHIKQSAWDRKGPPRAAAITVPSCYDQFHRRSVLQAAQLAGFRSVRLVDRSLAAAQALLVGRPRADQAGSASAPLHDIVVSITGNVTEAVVVRRLGERVQEIATVGEWHTGTLSWQQRLVDLAAEICRQRFGFDPRASLTDATGLQIACEKTLNQLMLHRTATLRFIGGGQPRELELGRDALLAAGRGLLADLRSMIQRALDAARLPAGGLQRCISVGMMTRLPQVRDMLREELGPDVVIESVERADLARGAAAAVAGELPGRGSIPLPPQAAAAHDLGILVHATRDHRRRVLPVIPRGTALPARTNRRLTVSQTRSEHTLTLVESAGWDSASWRSLGNHRLPVQQQPSALEVAFETDINGLLSIRVHNPSTGETERVPSLPVPTLDEAAVRHWRSWIEQQTAL